MITIVWHDMICILYQHIPPACIYSLCAVFLRVSSNGKAVEALGPPRLNSGHWRTGMTTWSPFQSWEKLYNTASISHVAVDVPCTLIIHKNSEIGILIISICYTNLFCGTSSGSRLHGRSAAGFSCQLLNRIVYRSDKNKRIIPLVPCNANWSRMKPREIARKTEKTTTVSACSCANN